jgi:hypothetical protein
MDGRVSCFFVELLLHWGTSSLTYLFSQRLLLWAATYLGYFFPDSALSCLPASSSVASATQFLVCAALTMDDSALLWAPLNFSNVCLVKSSSRYSFVHILPTSSSKSCDFEVRSELSLQSCALFVDNFPRSSPEPAETETLLATPGATLVDMIMI